jgi:hypothetical protein
MPAPAAASWSTTRAYHTYLWHDGSMLAGTYRVIMQQRVGNAPSDATIPAGLFASGLLNTTPGSPSFDMQVPCNDDPDNFPNGWQLVIRFDFSQSGIEPETFIIDTPTGVDINLRTVILAETIPDAVNVLIRDVPGGLATLDTAGKLKTEQIPDGIGGGVESWAEVTATTDYPASGLVLGDDARLTNQRTPTDGSVTAAKVASGLHLLTTAERTQVLAAQSAAQVDTRADARIDARITGSPAAYDTFLEIANAMAADDTVATALAATVATKAPKTEGLGVRVKSGGTWPARPTGYASVLSIGADPSPLDQVAGDLRWIPQ